MLIYLHLIFNPMGRPRSFGNLPQNTIQSVYYLRIIPDYCATIPITILRRQRAFRLGLFGREDVDVYED